ncbi:MAG: hypothetical protein J5892_04025 [Bacilli bacterium]|nr:hypothetical protein [Bacilli bacterium]
MNFYMKDNEEVMMDNNMDMGASTCPIMECPQERIVNRYMYYNVPHLIPCNTRIINHHIYRHTYQPIYTCCEENVCSEINATNPCNF